MTEKPLAPADRLAPLRAVTPARIFLPNAGAAVATSANLDFSLAHARARDAVGRSLDADALTKELHARELNAVYVESAAADRRAYLAQPDLGRRLNEASRQLLADLSGEIDMVFVVADGLSAGAVMAHAVPLLDAVLAMYHAESWTIGPVALVRQGRVAIGDEIGQILKARLVAVLIGERPGLSAPESLGVYLTFSPRIGRSDSERNCLSNIHTQGMSYAEAAQRLFFLSKQARQRKVSGVELKDESDTTSPASLGRQQRLLREGIRSDL
ncbi:MAG: ethanolamine ammonia-lyase subunit EutC [Methylocystis sp.]|uniref:ethanolamine ammonia-lyase subunit EutC n=1 Tax=Methylocystis sp. TaxID=1911079 RepID=UPI003DA3DE4F